MDFFGIGNSLRGMFELYLRMSRRTGRTSLMLEHAKDGDRIVFSDERQKRQCEDLLRRMGKDKVQCVVVSPKRPMDVFERGTPPGTLTFDHSWLEQYYQHRLDEATALIDKLQREGSGFGMAHVETQLAVEARHKLGYF